MMRPVAVSPVPDPAPAFEADLIARLRAGLEAIWPEGASAGAAKLGIAVSGGPDSLALLLLAHAALPGRIEAATVDHGLRRESADEAAMVAQVCARLGVPHAVLAVEVSEGNLQAQARKARYAALAVWMRERKLAALATAHHADDQAETLLMRLNRASGVAGLAGVRPRGVVPETDLPLLRPLLGWRREELAGIVASAGLTAADDPSNGNDRFDRVRIRKALGQADWLDVAALASSAEYLAEADAALEWSASFEYRNMVKHEAFGLLYRPYAPRAIALRVVARIVRELDGEAPRGSAVARLFDGLCEGRTGSIGNLTVRPNAAGWSFSKAPVRAAKKRD